MLPYNAFGWGGKSIEAKTRFLSRPKVVYALQTNKLTTTPLYLCLKGSLTV